MDDLTVQYPRANPTEVIYDFPPAGPPADTNVRLREVAGSTYTLQSLDHGKFVHFTAACVVTVPSTLSDGFACVLVRDGTGDVEVAAGAGVTLRHPDNHTQLRLRYSSLSLWKRSAGVYYLGGDTKA